MRSTRTEQRLANGTLKLSAHANADPLNPTDAKASLWFKADDALVRKDGLVIFGQRYVR